MYEYNNAGYGIAFEIPDDWKLFENAELGGMQILPIGTEGQPLPLVNLSILVREQGEVNPDDPGILNYIASEIVRSNFANYENHVLHSLRQGAVGQRPSREIIFSYNDLKHEEHMQALQVVTVASGYLFLFTYTASVRHFTDRLQQVAQMMISVRFAE